MAEAVLLVGGTGLVGRSVARQLTVEGRAPVQLVRRAGDTGAIVADPRDWPNAVRESAPAVVISALGTTIKQAGSQAAFRAVDHDLVLAVARAAHDAGARQCIAVSSVGADAASGNFYLRTKGEVEEALSAMDWQRLDILRPGLLIGERGGPVRVGERIGAALSPLTDALLRGSLDRYRSIAADTVAAAIVVLTRCQTGGVYRHHNRDMLMLARSVGHN